MESKPSANSFREVHAKIKTAKDNLLKASEARTGIRRENAEKAALQNGVDRPATEPVV